jgi:glycosyltransferase involved in cell wall biosynthesis
MKGERQMDLTTKGVWNSPTSSMNLIKLSILIPTIPQRKDMLDNLMNEFRKQYSGEDVIMITCDNDKSIGAKRNELLQAAKSEYVCFFDDDDLPSSTYIEDLLKAIESNPDCVSLRGVITWDGVNPELFEHSIKYKAWITTTNNIKYERPPTPLNCIKSSIAKQFNFPEINHGEDRDWSNQLNESGLLKNEVYIDKVLYHYKFITNK